MAKKNKSVKNVPQKQSKNTNQHYFFFAAIILTLTVPLFFQGAFFPRQILMTQMAILLLFFLWMFQDTFQSRRIQLLNDGWSLIILGFALVYSVPLLLFRWASLDQGIGMVLWYLTLFFLYWMVKEFVSGKEREPLFLDAYLLAGVLMALVGFLNLSGYMDLTDGVMGSRIAGTFQYPNTLAAFLMTLYFIACGQLLQSSHRGKIIFYAASGWFMLLVFILTYSRAAWLLFPLMALAYFVLIPRKHKLMLLLYYTISAVTLLAVLQPLISQTTGLEEGSPLPLLTAIAAMGVATGIYFLLQRVHHRFKERFEKPIYAAFAAIAALGIGFLLLAYNTTIPQEFENTDESPRTQQIRRNIEGVYPGEYQLTLHIESRGGDEEEWPWQLLVDALKEDGSTDRILTDSGEPDASGTFTYDLETPEGTEGVRLTLQNRFPSTRVVFSDAQITSEDGQWMEAIPMAYRYIPEGLVTRFQAIDMEQGSASTRVAYYRDAMTMFSERPFIGAGGGAWEHLYQRYQSQPYTSRQAHNFFLQTLVETGILGLLLMLGIIAFILRGLYKAYREKNLFVLSLYVAIISLLAHSALDFNFSYYSIAMMFFALLALLPHEKLEWQKLEGLKNIKAPAMLLLLLTIPVIILTGLRYSALSQGNTARYAAAHGDTESAYYLFDSAIGRNPFNPQYRFGMANFLIDLAFDAGQTQFLQEADQHLERGLHYTPGHNDLLRQKLSVYAARGDTEGFLAHSEQLIQYRPLNRNTYEFVAGTANAYARSWIDDGELEEAERIFSWNLELITLKNQANEQAKVPAAFTGGFKTAMQEARAFQLVHQQGEDLSTLHQGLLYASFPDLLYAMGDERAWRVWGRDDAELETELTAEGLLTTNSGTDLGLAYTPNLDMEPETEYTVWVDLAEISLQAPMNIRIIATDSDDNRTQHSHTHDPAEDGLQASFTFTTTEDIEPGNQYVRFDHPGNDDGSFIIKGIVVHQVTDRS